MFYNTEDPHGLPHGPFKSCIVPRPIAWISTMSKDGIVNLAPYSFFNGISETPPMVMFSSTGSSAGQEGSRAKDTITNIEDTGEFVVNMATWELQDELNGTSAMVGSEINEAELVGLETISSNLVAPPLIKVSPINMECTLFDIIELPSTLGDRNAMVIGHVKGIHIDDNMLTDGLIDVAKIRPLARLGYKQYTSVTEVFELTRPG